MSAEAETIATADLRAFVERIERVEEEIKALNTDKSDIYKEARGRGWDVKTIRKVVSARKLDPNERQECDALFDLYMNALGMSSHVHVHTRETIDPVTGEILKSEGAGTPISYSSAENGSDEISAPIQGSESEAPRLPSNGLTATVSDESAVIDQPETAKESPHHLVPTRGDDVAMASSQKIGSTGRQPVDTLRAGRTGSITVTGGESAADDGRDVEAFGGAASVVTHSNPHCQKPETCQFARKPYSCSECIRAYELAKAAKRRVAA